MEHKITVTETVKLKDNFTWELEVDAVVFRNEFEKYLHNSQTDNHAIIFAFIFLQIYIEYCLHQNMRRIIRLEFKNTDSQKYQDWIEHEGDFIEDKASVRPGKLSHFIKCFFDANNNVVLNLKSKIEKIFKDVTSIRNRLVHGHKISVSGNSMGNRNISKTKALLTQGSLLNVIKNVNELGGIWNELLDSILSRCKALRSVNDFRFKNLKDTKQNL